MTVPSPAKFPLPIGVQLSALGLTAQESLFVDLYRQTGDAMASAVRAKMSDPAYPIDVLAQRTLDRRQIQEALRLLDEAERETRAGHAKAKTAPAVRMPVVVTKDTIMADLQQVFEVAMGFDWVQPAEGLTAGETEDRKAIQAAVRPVNLGAAIASKKVQASVAGLLATKVDVNFRMTVDEMPDSELLKIAKQGKFLEGDFQDVTPDDKA